MKTDELRESYLEFFESKGCVRRPSDVLVPTWDPSVLFTPAGMNQFKDHFLGRCKLEFTRAATCQKCLRTGDIENVGRTAYHHTFFEMLGNFSFGDYFKREAINWAWEYLTSKKWLGLDAARLSVSVYVDDDEAAEIWASDIKLPPEKIVRMGEDDNFWPAGAPSQGPDGVCGPCSEIFYHPPGGGEEVEIWNLVFTQFNRVGDPPDNLRPLPSKNIDTGMGLERTAGALQGVDTNYHIDILRPLVEAAGEVCGTSYVPGSEEGRRLRRIADHVRAGTFAVHENVYPGPNKEKYVIRRLLRRAVLDGHQLGLRDPFLHQLVPVVAEMMKNPYPELGETLDRVAKVIRQEEGNFFHTIDEGLERIHRIFGDMSSAGRTMVAGQDVFFMYDTHGFPPELFEQLATEKGLTFDWRGFQEIVEAKGGGPGGPVFTSGPLDRLKETVKHSEFLGYESVEAEGKLVGIIVDNELVSRLQQTGDKWVTVVLDRSPFYGEAGGQVGDTGELSASGMRFEVTDTKRDGDLILHVGHLREGTVEDGQSVTARVDSTRRLGIRRAHSATHILHYALRKQLGEHAQQQGSKVDDDWLRFDFTNLEALDEPALDQIESEVSSRVSAGEEIRWKTLPLAEARSAGAMMLFGEKYPDPVRMVSMGEFSKELCGGTHLQNTGQVEDFELLSEESVSAGVRRVVALTGAKAREHQQQVETAARKTAELLGVKPAQIAAAVTALTGQVRELKKQLASGGKPPMQSDADEAKTNSEDAGSIRRALNHAARALNVAPLDVPHRVRAVRDEIARLQEQVAASPQGQELSADELLAGATDVSGAKVIVAQAEGANANRMRQTIDQLRRKGPPVAVLLASGGDKALLVAGLSRDLVERGAHAGNWVKQTAAVVGGGGGGKPDMAQAGGKHPEKLPDALDKAREVIAEMLAE